MGSPLSPIFTNIFMEEFEQKALALAQFKPRIWWRYVDNTFADFPQGHTGLNECDVIKLWDAGHPSALLKIPPCGMPAAHAHCRRF
ncbi:hypothetical protein J6590_041289 [Homalodisca vitripennis]|nr:hypothetical protein J6590_041289 [Homalodisca vitripennis]